VLNQRHRGQGGKVIRLPFGLRESFDVRWPAIPKKGDVHPADLDSAGLA
jgi:hypothetical protein